MDTSAARHFQGATLEDEARARGTSEVLQVQQGALDRHARIYRPAERAHQPGLVILLHGAVGPGEEMARLTNFDAQVDRFGWIAVYPGAHNPGPNGGWDAHACCGQPGVNDVDFIRQLIDTMTRSDAIDPSRVYIAGFSRGGMMAYRLGCELAHRVTAIAAVAGNMSDRHGNIDAVRCRPLAPVSLLAIHGTDDRNVPIEGGAGPDELAYFKDRPDLMVLEDDLITYAPLSEVVGFWRQVDDCSEIEEVESSPLATTRRWRGPDGVCVEVVRIEGGTHAWPGPAHPPGTPDGSVDASEVVADFFARHQRSKRLV